MKNKIKQAGFKTQKEIAEYLDKNELTVSRWLKNPPKLFMEWLRLRAINNNLEKIETLRDNIDKASENKIQ